MGVGFASLASSFGEITFLSLTTLYSRSLSISGWASGTGAAGLIGSFGYAALTSIGLSPRDTILIMLFIPVLMTFSYILLPSVEFAKNRNYQAIGETTDSDQIDSDSEIFQDLKQNRNNLKTKLFNFIKLLRPLLKFMIPLFLVYFAEYFINQGLFELLYFKDAFIKDHKLQYRYFNFCQKNLFKLESYVKYFFS